VPKSVAVVLVSLVPNGTHDHRVVNDFKPHDIASTAKRDDQLTQKAIARLGLAAGVRRPGQHADSFANCDKRALKRRPIRYFARELTFDREVFDRCQSTASRQISAGRTSRRPNTITRLRAT
jgi:hypothetical protein